MNLLIAAPLVGFAIAVHQRALIAPGSADEELTKTGVTRPAAARHGRA
jgi:hypothetical protein